MSKKNKQMTFSHWATLLIMAAAILQLVQWWVILIPFTAEIIFFLSKEIYKSYRKKWQKRNLKNETVSDEETSNENFIQQFYDHLRTHGNYRKIWTDAISMCIYDEYHNTTDTHIQMKDLADRAAERIMSNLLREPAQPDGYNCRNEPVKFPPGGVASTSDHMTDAFAYAIRESGIMSAKREIYEKRMIKKAEEDLLESLEKHEQKITYEKTVGDKELKPSIKLETPPEFYNSIPDPQTRREFTIKHALQNEKDKDLFCLKLRSLVIPPGYMYNLNGWDETNASIRLKLRGDQLSDNQILWLYKNSSFDFDIEKADNEFILEVIAKILDNEYEYTSSKGEKCIGILLLKDELLYLFFHTNQLQEQYQRQKGHWKKGILLQKRKGIVSLARMNIEPERQYYLEGFFKENVTESEYQRLMQLDDGFGVKGASLSDSQILWLVEKNIIEIPF